MKSENVNPLESCQGPALTVDCMAQKLSGIPEPPRIFRGIIKPSLGCFFGPAKSGKTTLVENLAFSIASGQKTFLGDEINTESRRVMIVSLEEYCPSRTARNMRQMDGFEKKYSPAPGWRNNVFVVDDSFPRYLTNEEHWELLDAEISRIQPEFVALDSVTRTTFQPIEDSTVANILMKRLRDTTHKHNIALVLIHHTQKMDDRPLTISSMAGSRVIGQEMDFMIGVNRTTQNVRYLKNVAFRYWPDDSEYVHKFSIDSNQMIVDEGEVYESDMLVPAVSSTVLFNSDVILQNHFHEMTGGDGSVLVKTAELYGRLVTTGLMSRPTLHSGLKRLETAGIIIKPEKGCYRLNIPS